AQARRATAAALPRPAPYLRHADDRASRHPPRAGVDGARRRPDNDALLALRPSPRRRRPGRRRIPAWRAIRGTAAPRGFGLTPRPPRLADAPALRGGRRNSRDAVSRVAASRAVRFPWVRETPFSS